MSIDHGKLLELADDIENRGDKWAADKLRALAQPAEAVEGETDIIRNDVHRVLAEGDGYWQACSGCHETNQGYETGLFPYSETFKCHLGSGCTECGGLGAIWFEIPTVAELEQPADAAQGAVADSVIKQAVSMARQKARVVDGELGTLLHGLANVIEKLAREPSKSVPPVGEVVKATGELKDMHIICWRDGYAPRIGDHLYITPPADTHPQAAPAQGDGSNHKIDTDTHVFFYEQDFYVLSNFSAFTLQWKGRRFDTSEAAYHWEKFNGTCPEVQDMILEAPSAHAAFKLAESQKCFRRADWDEVKLDVMRDILRAKAAQHEYVRRKLLATGERTLVEDSWRDDYWGWGPNRDGKNWLGRLWMEVRAELAAAPSQERE